LDVISDASRMQNAWRETKRVPSTIHGMICGAGSVYLIFFTDAFDNDVVKGYHSLCDWVCAVSFGYEVYDLVIMVLQKDFSIVFWTHHLSLCIGYILTVVCRSSILYPPFDIPASEIRDQ